MEHIYFPKGKVSDKEFYEIVGETREKINEMKEGLKYIMFDPKASLELERLSRLSIGIIRKENGKISVGTGNNELDESIFIRSLHYSLYLTACQKQDLNKWYNKILPFKEKNNRKLLNSVRELARINMKEFNISEKCINRIFECYGLSFKD